MTCLMVSVGIGMGIHSLENEVGNLVLLLSFRDLRWLWKAWMGILLIEVMIGIDCGVSTAAGLILMGWKGISLIWILGASTLMNRRDVGLARLFHPGLVMGKSHKRPQAFAGREFGNSHRIVKTVGCAEE